MRCSILQSIQARVANACAPSSRSTLEGLLKENYLTPGGEENIKCFFRDEGYQTGISNVLKVVLLPSPAYQNQNPQSFQDTCPGSTAPILYLESRYRVLATL